MKKIALLLLIFLTISKSFAQDCNWLTTKDYERGYRIDFPQKPVVQSQEIATEVGSLTMDMNMVDLSANSTSDNMLYMVAYTAYPEGSDYDNEELQHSMLDGTVNGAVTNVNGKLISSKNIVLNGYNGRYAKISIYDDTIIISLKTILVNNELYLLQIMTETSKQSNENIDKFLDSFDLIRIKN